MKRRSALATLTLSLTALSSSALVTTASADSVDVTFTVIPSEPVVPSQNDAVAIAELTIAPNSSLSGVKASGAAAIAKRQRTLTDLATKLASQTTDCGQNAAMQSQITATASSLTSVGQQLAASTDLAAARTLNESIYTRHRVYLLVSPKAGKVLRCDGQLVRNTALNAEATRLQATIDAARLRGVDTTAAQATKDAAVAQLATINPAPALAGIMGLIPDGGDRALQAANSAALKNADALLDATAALQKNVGKQFDTARSLIRGERRESNDARKAAKEASKEAEKRAKEAAKDAEKAAKEARRAAERAAKDARRGNSGRG